MAPWLLCPLAAAAQSNMNMQGMSGLFNVPDASVLEYGTAVLAHDRQVDGRFARPRTRNAAGNDMTISAGAFPHVEVVGRNVTTTTTTGGSDLSFNIKLQLPWELIEGVDFAIGEMDLGGSVNEYDTQFGVVTAQLGDFRTTIGFGKADGKAATGTGRLDGVFYGVEYLATDWLSLIVEDDVHTLNTGLRLMTPPGLLPEGWKLAGSYMLSQEEGVKDRQDWYGLALTLPLSADYDRKIPKSRDRQPPAVAYTGKVVEERLDSNDAVDLTAPPQSEYIRAEYRAKMRSAENLDKVENLRRRFRHADFEQVRVQRNGNEWVIAFENYRYNANAIDALGIAAGIAAEALPEGSRFYLQMEKYGVPIFGMGGDSSAWGRFLNDDAGMPESVLIAAPSNRIRRRSNQGMLDAVLGGTLDYLAFRPTLAIKPVVSSTLGTEFGVLDYSVAARADLMIPLWKGAALNMTRDWSVYETEDFTEEGVFGGVFRNQAVPSGFRDRIISQTIRHGKGFTTMISAGRFFRVNDGVMVESRWEPGDGRHRFRALATDFDFKHIPGLKREARLWSYRYFAESTNSELNLTAGSFSAGDNGYRFDFTQHIGDTRIHLTYKDSEGNKFAGIGFTIPLTPRQDMARIGGLQVVGAARWRYDISTILGEQGNRLVFGPNVIPTAGFNLRNAYFNVDRLIPAYVRANQERLRDAWLKYGAPQQRASQ